AAVPARR
ncbi:phage minor tail protein L, partial [Escherichia coli EC1868]